MKKAVIFTIITLVSLGLVLLVRFLLSFFGVMTSYLNFGDYALITGTTLATFYTCAFLLAHFPKYVGAAYTGIGFIKLIVVGAWFFPYISNLNSEVKIYVLSFFAVYFFFQFIEVITLVRILAKLKFKKSE